MDPMLIVYSVFVFLLTTCIGSFLNVVIYRLPNKMSLAFPASHCPTCNHKLAWYDNIPLFSYLFLRGRCRYCNCSISPRYFIVELCTGVFSTLIFIKFGLTWMSLFGILLLLVLVPISFIDIEHHIIPDRFQLILLAIGIASIFLNDINYGAGIINVTYKSKLFAFGLAIAFGLVMLLLQIVLKKELIGGGDLKLLIVVSFSLGWELLVFALGVASIIASIVEIIAIGVKKKKIAKLSEKEELSEVEEDEINGLFPFGPYLSIGIMISYVFGITILEWWLNMITF